MAMAQDPSIGVQPELLPHLHLVSALKYPQSVRTDIQNVTKILLEASRLAKTPQGPFFWTYLDRPDDGTMLVTWQPFSRVGPQFATDGYIWASPETYYKQDIGNGMTLEVYYYKSGYNPASETVTLHMRKRFRLIPTPGSPPSPNQPDPSLFLVHYSPAEEAGRIPINTIPYEERIQALMTSRANAMRLGSIPRKDFLLGDRPQWPQVALPRDGRPSFVANTPQRGVPQQMAFPAHPPTAAPPSKRARHSAAAAAVAAPPPLVAQQPPPPPPPEAIMAEEEDNFRGDFFDHITPRELAMLRYQNNHEWMEQVTASPYPLSSIIAPELGLGRFGPLAELTEGIFEAQGVDALRGASENPYVQPLDSKKADKFRKRVEEHIAASKDEMKKMAADHEKALAKSKANRELIKFEKELRTAVFPDGTDAWSVNGGVDGDDDGSITPRKPTSKVSDVIAAVEQKLGVQVTEKTKLERVQDGGYVPPPERGPTPDLLPESGDADVEMGGTGSGSGSGDEKAVGEKGEWVMVHKNQEGVSQTAVPVPPIPGAKGDSGVGTPAGGFDGGDFNSLGDMDTAGEALSSYENMEMEESAFGDAFHGVDANTPQP